MEIISNLPIGYFVSDQWELVNSFPWTSLMELALNYIIALTLF
jgi:hypothetical protein